MDADSVWRPVEQPVTVTDADAEAADLDADEIEAAERKMRQLTLQPSDTACKFRNRRSEMYVETKELPGFFSFRSNLMTLSRFFSSSSLRYYFVAGAPNVKQMRAFDLYVEIQRIPRFLLVLQHNSNIMNFILKRGERGIYATRQSGSGC